MAYMQIEGAADAAKVKSLKQALLRGIVDMGYENKLGSIIYPAILKRETNHCLIPFDSISDQEKVLIYCTSIIEMVDLSRGECQAVIFGKSEKFLKMTETTIECLTKHMELKKSSVLRVDKGSIGKDPQQWSILLGNPGEILELFRRRSINMENLSWVIFDELEKFTVPEYVVVSYLKNKNFNCMHTSSLCFGIVIKMLQTNSRVGPLPENANHRNCAIASKNTKKEKKNLRSKSSSGHLRVYCDSNKTCYNENCADGISAKKMKTKRRNKKKKNPSTVGPCLNAVKIKETGSDETGRIGIDVKRKFKRFA
ncbi:uncharacterized protein LOC135831838 [Planococcus citri]|uniref:uncharacterized protein LOC135831838 n=1 Tax=Planococcus citri TaxID=170843 RepID=UPI0031F98DDA